MPYIVTDESNKEYFIEAQAPGAAFTQVPRAVSVRVAQQQDIEKHVFGGQAKADPQDIQKQS